MRLVTWRQPLAANVWHDRTPGGVIATRVERVATPLARSEAAAVWLEYRRTRDARLRDRLIACYAPLVRRIAYGKAARLRDGCDVEEFISYGLLQLMIAIDCYDPMHGAAPEAFLWVRVHDAVCDHVRMLEWVPRSVRRTERKMQAARLEFAAVQGRPPTSAEVADALGVPVRDVRRHERRIAAAKVDALNEIVIEGEDPEDLVERIDRIDVLHDIGASSDHSRAAAVAQRFRASFYTLTERQREVAMLLYVDKLTLGETAARIGQPESRVARIQGEIRSSLGLILRDDAPLAREVAWQH